MVKFKRFIFNFVFILISLSVLTLMLSPVASAGIMKSYSWYVKKTQDHSKPPLPSEFEFINQFGGYYVDNNNSSPKRVYLTFDAGYENGNVSKILDALKENNVKGTFFVLSNLVINNTELVNRMMDEGHIVGNHTSKHLDMSKVKNKDELEKELFALEKVFKDKTGKEISKFFRPPEGRFSENMIEYAYNLGYKTIFWSLAYADWDNNKQVPLEEAKNKIMDNIHNGAIILLHPTSNTNASILSDIIKDLKMQGYTFGTIDELCSINKEINNG